MLNEGGLHIPGSLIILMLDPESVDSGVSALVGAVRNRCAVELCSDRWDQDKREIWQIPEARDLFLDTVALASLEIDVKSVLAVLGSSSLQLLRCCQHPELVVTDPPSGTCA